MNVAANTLAVVNAALARAHRASRSDGRIRVVLETPYGVKISTRKHFDMKCRWTNGVQCGCWHPGDHEGRFDPILTHHIETTYGITPRPTPS